MSPGQPGSPSQGPRVPGELAARSGAPQASPTLATVLVKGLPFLILSSSLLSGLFISNCFPKPLEGNFVFLLVLFALKGSYPPV